MTVDIWQLPQINETDMKFSAVVIGQSLIVVMKSFEILEVRGTDFTDSEALLL